MKYCIKCNIEKDDSDFYSGRNVCKVCRKEQNKQWRQNNPEAIKEHKKQYRQNNAEAIKEHMKQYYQNNIEAIKEQMKQYRQNNAEEIKEKNKQYYQNNLQKMMLRKAKTRAKQKNVPFNINEQDLVIPSICPVLGIPLEAGIGKRTIQPNSPTLDRIIPDKGYVKGNIIVVSSIANIIKNNATPEQIIAVGEFYKKILEEAKNNV